MNIMNHRSDFDTNCLCAGMALDGRQLRALRENFHTPHPLNEAAEFNNMRSGLQKLENYNE